MSSMLALWAGGGAGVHPEPERARPCPGGPCRKPACARPRPWRRGAGSLWLPWSWKRSGRRCPRRRPALSRTISPRACGGSRRTSGGRRGATPAPAGGGRGSRAHAYAARKPPPAPVLPVRLGAPGVEPTVFLVALVDTGADLSVVPEQVPAQAQLPRVGEITIRGVGGSQRRVPLFAAAGGGAGATRGGEGGGG